MEKKEQTKIQKFDFYSKIKEIISQYESDLDQIDSEEITNGKDGIFANPNQVVDMPSIDENVETAVSKDDFDKMGYNQRLELKKSNPELFNKYNNS